MALANHDGRRILLGVVTLTENVRPRSCAKRRAAPLKCRLGSPKLPRSNSTSAREKPRTPVPSAFANASFAQKEAAALCAENPRSCKKAHSLGPNTLLQKRGFCIDFLIRLISIRSIPTMSMRGTLPIFVQPVQHRGCTGNTV